MSIPKPGPLDASQSGSSSDPSLTPLPQTSPPSSPVHASYDSSSDASASSVAEQAKGVFSGVLSSESAALSSAVTPTSAAGAAAAAAATHTVAMARMSSSHTPLAFTENDQAKFETAIRSPEGLAALCAKSPAEIFSDMQRIHGEDSGEIVSNYLIAHLDPQKMPELVRLCVSQESSDTFLRGDSVMVKFVKKQPCLDPLSLSLKELGDKIIKKFSSLKVSNHKKVKKAVLSAMDGIIACARQNSSFDTFNLTGAIRKARKDDDALQVISFVILRKFNLANQALGHPNRGVFSIVNRVIMFSLTRQWDNKIQVDLEPFRTDATFQAEMRKKFTEINQLL
jgi:hypothetical protein